MDPPTAEIYTLSPTRRSSYLGPGGGHGRVDRLRRPPAVGATGRPARRRRPVADLGRRPSTTPGRRDRKSTRLNSSHANISYAVFCLKKKILVCAQLAHVLTKN